MFLLEKKKSLPWRITCSLLLGNVLLNLSYLSEFWFPAIFGPCPVPCNGNCKSFVRLSFPWEYMLIVCVHLLVTLYQKVRKVVNSVYIRKLHCGSKGVILAFCITEAHPLQSCLIPMCGENVGWLAELSVSYRMNMMVINMLWNIPVTNVLAVWPWASYFNSQCMTALKMIKVPAL